MLVLALVIGFVAGLRTMMGPAVIAWAAMLGVLNFAGTWFSFLGWRFTLWILSLFAVGELYIDKKSSTPSRRVPAQFTGRLLSGGAAGAATGYDLGALLLGLLLGIIGAVIGTLAGSAERAQAAACCDP